MYVIKPEVQKLSEEEIQKALAQKDEDSLILQELSRLLQALLEHAPAWQDDPAAAAQAFRNRAPSCPLEKVALDIVGDMLAAETAREDQGSKK